MNLKGLAEKLDFDVDDLVEMLDTFVEATSSDLGQMNEAMEMDALPQVARSAHSIKGAAVSFGLEEVYEPAMLIESNARRGISDGCTEAAESIEEWLNVIIAAIEDYREHPGA